MTPKLSDEEVQERKSRIIKAALTCFARKGYHQTTMDDIVAESGLSKGGVYWHFKSKRDLFTATITHAFGGSPDVLEASLLESTASATEQVYALLDFFTQMMVSGPLLETVPIILEAWSQNVRDPEMQELSAQVFEQYRRPLAQLIESGIAAGEFKAVDSMMLVSILIGVYDGLSVQALADPEAIDWNAVRDTLAKTLLAGLMERGAEHDSETMNGRR